MATIKSFTDLSQSKTLSKILPLESADMYYHYNTSVVKNYHEDIPNLIQLSNHFAFFNDDIPCWSLAALLDVLDDIVVDDEGNEYSLTISKEEGMCYIYYHDRWGEVDDIETDCYYDLVDACYEMIIKLHEQKLL